MDNEIATCPKCSTPLVDANTGHYECPVCGLYMNGAFLNFYKKKEEKDEHETNPGI